MELAAICLPLANDTVVQLRLQLVKNPTIALLVWNELFDYAKLSWQIVDEDLAEVKVKFDTPTTTDTLVRIVFIGA